MPKTIWLVPLVPFVGLTFNRAVYHYGLFLGLGDIGADMAAFLGTLVAAASALFCVIVYRTDGAPK